MMPAEVASIKNMEHKITSFCLDIFPHYILSTTLAHWSQHCIECQPSGNDLW